MSDDRPVIALDVGGTSVKAGRVVGGRVDDVRRVPLDHRADADALVGVLATTIADLASSPLDPVAIAVPDPFDHAAGVSLMEHKFVALHGVDLTAALRAAAAHHGPIRYVNDAVAAGAGHVRALSAPRGTTLVLTLGTGLGSSLFDDLQPVAERDGIVIGDLWRSPTPSSLYEVGPIVDDVFSATGLARTLGVALDDLADTVDGAPVNPTTARMLARWATTLGTWIEHLAPRLGADLTIVAGGAAAGFGRYGDDLRSAATSTEVQAATLGATGAVIGAAAVCFA